MTIKQQGEYAKLQTGATCLIRQRGKFTFRIVTFLCLCPNSGHPCSNLYATAVSIYSCGLHGARSIATSYTPCRSFSLFCFMSTIVISNYVALYNGRENHNKMKTKLPFSCFPQLQRSGSQFIWFSANFY